MAPGRNIEVVFDILNIQNESMWWKCEHELRHGNYILPISMDLLPRWNAFGSTL
jgi:hypothetical protein